MTNSIENIVAGLDTTLSAITELVEVYPYGLKEIDKTPAIDIFWEGADIISWETLGTVKIKYRFVCTIYIYLTDNKTIQDRQKTLAHLVLMKLYKNPGLGGTTICDTVEVATIRNGQAQDHIKVFAFTEFTILVTKEEPLT